AVIGAGGVARAIVAGLSNAGADITIYNRTLKKAAALANEFGCRYTHLNDLPEINASLLINCTSIGMYPDIDAAPVTGEVLNKNMAVFDTVYNPAKTTLLKLARAKRAKTIDGVSMFVNQAMAQFRLFTGKNADAQKMRRIVTKFLVTNG
ncbi:MAG: shikimate dehydrogenase, partial [Candidatus Brocadiia bacterium]